MTTQEARAFAEEWIAAWNAHDLERILAHYTDDFEMATPFIRMMGLDPSGKLKGKDKVRAYWAQALKRFPDLRFDLVDVFAGTDSLAVCYRSVLGKTAVEVFHFDISGKIDEASAHYDTL